MSYTCVSLLSFDPDVIVPQTGDVKSDISSKELKHWMYTKYDIFLKLCDDAMRDVSNYDDSKTVDVPL